jgi:hypothetical protein
MVGLRWLIVEHSIEQYDDRDKEWDTRTWEDERVLQYFDGKRWRDVPTVKRKAKPNDPSSATRPTGRRDCNSDARAGFAAAHG